MDETEFCLLGPLLVTTRGVGVPVAPGKQRALLAALLLNANKTVSQDELADVLWGNDLPPSARVTLHNYVKRLRRAVHVTGDTRIRTSAGGYEIRAFQSLPCAGAQIAHVADWRRYDLQPTMRLNHYNPRLETETAAGSVP